MVEVTVAVLPLEAKFILGPGRKGLTALPAVILLLGRTVVLDTVSSLEEVSAGTAVVLVRGLELKDGLGFKEGLEDAVVLCEESSCVESGEGVALVRERGDPNLDRFRVGYTTFQRDRLQNVEEGK